MRPGTPPTDGELLTRRYFEELFNRQHLQACDEIVAPLYTEHATAPFGGPEPGLVGPEATRETVRWLLDQFPDLHFTVEAVVVSGDLIAALVLGEGTNLGPIGPIPATGKRFSSRATHWFRTEGNRLAEHWATRDDLTTMLQLGLVVRPV